MKSKNKRWKMGKYFWNFERQLPLWRNSPKRQKRTQIDLKSTDIDRWGECDRRKCKNLTSGVDDLLLQFTGSLIVCLTFASVRDSLLPCETIARELVQR